MNKSTTKGIRMRPNPIVTNRHAFPGIEATGFGSENIDLYFYRQSRKVWRFVLEDRNRGPSAQFRVIGEPFESAHQLLANVPSMITKLALAQKLSEKSLALNEAPGFLSEVRQLASSYRQARDFLDALNVAGVLRVAESDPSDVKVAKRNAMLFLLSVDNPT